MRRAIRDHETRGDGRLVIEWLQKFLGGGDDLIDRDARDAGIKSMTAVVGSAERIAKNGAAGAEWAVARGIGGAEDGDDGDA